MRHYFHPLCHNNIIYFIVGVLAGAVLILVCVEIPGIAALRWQELLGAAATILAGYMALLSVLLPNIWQSHALLGLIKNEAARYADILKTASDEENMTGSALLAVFMTDRDIPDNIRQAALVPERMIIPNDQLFLLPRPVVESYITLTNLSNECQRLTRNSEFSSSEEAQHCLVLFRKMAGECRKIASYPS